MQDLIKRLKKITVVRYLFVGGSSYTLELSLLLAMVHLVDLSTALATTIAYWFGLCLAFALQKLVAFQDYRRELKILTKQGLLFAILTLWNWLFTVFVVELFPADHLIWSRSAALVIMSAWNYAIYKHFIFKDHTAAPSVKSLKSTKPKNTLWWLRLRNDPLLYWSIGLVTAWRVILEIFNQVTGPHAHFIGNLTRWYNWDGGWYLNIIQYGYHNPERIANVAFFPGFPQLVALLSRITTIDIFYVGLILNFILTVLAIYLLMKLSQLVAIRWGATKQQQTIALLTAVGFLSYFSTFFLAAFYADALLILGFIGATYFALTNRYWIASIFAIMASLSKITGIIACLIMAIIALEQWLHERTSVILLIKKWLISSVGALGLVGYMTYLWLKFGDPILFYRVESVWGRDHEGFFVTDIAKGYYSYFFDYDHWNGFYHYTHEVLLMTLPFAVLAVGIFCAWVYRTAWPLVLGLCTVLIPLSTGLMESLNRYCLVLVPVLPLLIVWLSRRVRPIFLYILFAFMAVAMLGSLYGFLDGDYFAG
jgi:putative flippase GtrA